MSAASAAVALGGQFLQPAVSSGTSPIGRAGGRIGNNIAPNEQIDFNSLTYLWLTGNIGAFDYRTIARSLGWDVNNLVGTEQIRLFRGQLTFWSAEQKRANFDSRVANASLFPHERSILWNKQWPTQDELNTMFNRKLISQRTYDYISEWINNGESGMTRARQEMRFVIPPIGDLFRYVVKDCFSPDIVQRFNYNKEFPVEVLPWIEKQGLTGEVGIPLPPNSTTTKGPDTRTQVTFADLEWWSHWDAASVGQAYQMLQRFYSNSKHGPSPEYNADVHFDSSDLALLLKLYDYPPFWRKRFEALSYNVPGRVDSRRMYTYGLIDETKLYHYFRRQGYNDMDSTDLVELSKALRHPKQSQITPVETVETFCKQFKEGILSEDRFFLALRGMYMTVEAAQAYVDKCKTDIRMEGIKERKKYIEYGYYNGLMDDAGLELALSNLGIEIVTRERLIELWKDKKYFVKRLPTVRKVIQYYVDGTITRDIAQLRLRNMNYQYIDVEVMLANADSKIFAANLKAQEKLNVQQKRALDAAIKAAAKNAAAQVKTQLAESKARERALEIKIKQILSAFTEKNLVAWHKQGSISLMQVIDILGDKGWDENSTKAFIKQHFPEEYNANTKAIQDEINRDRSYVEEDFARD